MQQEEQKMKTHLPATEITVYYGEDTEHLSPKQQRLLKATFEAIKENKILKTHELRKELLKRLSLTSIHSSSIRATVLSLRNMTRMVINGKENNHYINKIGFKVRLPKFKYGNNMDKYRHIKEVYLK